MKVLALWLTTAALALASATDDFIATAKEKHGDFGEEAARFLVEHMPEEGEDGATALCIGAPTSGRDGTAVGRFADSFEERVFVGHQALRWRSASIWSIRRRYPPVSRGPIRTDRGDGVV